MPLYSTLGIGHILWGLRYSDSANCRIHLSLVTSHNTLLRLETDYLSTMSLSQNEQTLLPLPTLPHLAICTCKCCVHTKNVLSKYEKRIGSKR